MPLLRRRPLLRGAMVGGVGYAAGRRAAARAQQEADQTAASAQTQEPQPAPPAAAPPQPAPVGMSEMERIDALEKLKSLRDSGVLTEEQFQRERQRILGD